MGTWHDKLLASARKDFDHLKGSYVETGLAPAVCEHLRNESEQAPSVAIRREWALEGEDKGALVSVLARALYSDSKLHEYKSLEPLVGKAPRGETTKGCNKRIRSALREVHAGERNDAIANLTDAQLRAIAEETLSRLPRASGTCARMMECYWDLEAGERALGSKKSRAQRLASLQKACGRDAIPLPEEASVKRQEDFERACRRALIADAEQWLSDKGAKGKDYGDFSLARVKSLPVDFAETYLRGNPQLADELGLAVPAAPAPATENEGGLLQDAATLYWLLRNRHLEEGEYADACIPLLIDPMCGLGLYILGPDFTREIEEGVWRSLFGNRQRSPEDEGEFVLAAMYPKSDIDAQFKEAGDFENPDESLFEGEDEYGDEPKTAGARVECPWGLVVKAWVPDLILEKKLGPGSSIEKPYQEYRRMCQDRDGFEMYRFQNFDAPDGCPDRFKLYFLADDDAW